MSNDERGSRCEMKLGLRICPDAAPSEASEDGGPQCRLPPCREGCRGQMADCYDVAECTNTIWMNAVRHLLY